VAQEPVEVEVETPQEVIEEPVTTPCKATPFVEAEEVMEDTKRPQTPEEPEAQQEQELEEEAAAPSEECEIPDDVQEEEELQNGHHSDDDVNQVDEVEEPQVEEGEDEEVKSDSPVPTQVETDERASWVRNNRASQKSSFKLRSVTTEKRETEAKDEASEVQQKLEALKLKRQQSSSRKYSSNEKENDETEEERKERMKKLEERKKLREQKRLEEEERERKEAEEREAKLQEQQRIEREERERRRKEAEIKREEYRKGMTSQDDDVISTPLSPKTVVASPLSEKVNQLNKSITEAPKTTKTTPNVGSLGKAASLNDRLAKYNQASKQETKRTSSTAPKVIVSKDMKSVKNRWENAVNTTSNVKKMATPVAGNLASRKDMWESGQVQNMKITPVKKETSKLKVAPQFSSLKDQYLQKAASNQGVQKKNTIVTSQNVGNSLSKWESRSAQVQ